MQFKPKFIEKYSKLTDFEEYKKAVLNFPRKSVRANTLKSTVNEVKKIIEPFNPEKVSWCDEAFYVNKKVIGLGNLNSHWQGKFFIQSSVSMIPPLVLNPKESDLVADLCAAPGAKTTQLASMMMNKGLILANEIDKQRFHTLISNLQRCGVSNTVVTSMDIEKINQKFDKILLDAPCSGSGLIIGEKENTERTLLEWNPDTILRLAKLQKKLIVKAYSLLNEGGTLVYSTCSLEPEEDENVVEFLLSKTDARLEKIKLDIKSSHKDYLKIWPQYYQTEGFFVAKISKPALCIKSDK
ncbi:MAG TPA: RsmB/NOP family class I SAM-dependent RNA methyltransferase [Candidatus Nanoarchaeia archaeon]|nr:RsmB/NOP family class I SAM-dependent RNA methyltransferase [Candidatus Nanoarchaeia archaeon]